MGPYVPPEITADDHVYGPQDAPTTVVEYGDYECPYCRGAFRDVHLLLDRYPGQVRFAFRNFPISQLHPHAVQAAEAAEAAAAQGRFWQMYELLLQPDAHLDTEYLVGYARQLDLDLDRFRRDLDEHTYTTRIDHDVATGRANHVNSTPKFYVNGVRIDGKVPLEGLSDAVRAAVTARHNSPG